MIQIKSITIKEFRGIRDLTIDFDGNNYAICGPNGTGKSGVVDALEFALTGNVSRLSGEGRGDISLKEHGPHVDIRKKPDKARVSITIIIPHLDKTVTIERSVKNPSAAIVTPNDEDVLAVLNRVEEHSEVVLSRRELIRYVLAAPGKRADEVQALLRLDQVEQVRAGLQKIANNCERQLKPLEESVGRTNDSLLRALEVDELSTEKVLTAVNIRRATLGLAVLKDFTNETSLKEGMERSTAVQHSKIPKVQAVADLKAMREKLAEIKSETIIEKVDGVVEDLKQLSQDPSVEDSVKRERFYTVGMDVLAEDACPFCDTKWDLAALKKHVQIKIDHLNEISRKRNAIEERIIPLSNLVQSIKGVIETLSSYAARSEPPLTMPQSSEYAVTCKSNHDKMRNFLPLSDTISAVSSMKIVPDKLFEEINRVEIVVQNLPEPSKADAAREWLTLAQERLDVWRQEVKKLNHAKERAECSRKVSDIFAATNDKVLAGIYSNVEKQFAHLYRFANKDDESKFNAHLEPSLGKLGFGVDFYGRGMFPPGAYHSEGHQDSMGLCLYLALMRHILSDDFTFAVLDDVLMSVDASHRREVCALLKTEFPKTQFIMTTHDPIWLRHMKTEKLIGGRSAIQFRRWSVDSGPACWNERNIWDEILGHLQENSVREAAALLRNYLEYVAAELCHRLRAPVRYRGDFQYQLGELMPSAIKCMRDLYKSAKKQRIHGASRK